MHDFLKFLEKLRFTGDVWALPEGQLFFKDEPILEVTAPIIEAQLVETFIINQSTYNRSLPRRQLGVFMPQASGPLWISLYAEHMESMPG